jgi:putative toxin-antitoxin system antitoxin component (TIGR02293 family)
MPTLIEDWASTEEHAPPTSHVANPTTTELIRDDFEAWIPDDILRLAVAVFGDRQTARNWLRQPNLATGNVAPINLLNTAAGFYNVRNLLLRIQYGVLA